MNTSGDKLMKFHLRWPGHGYKEDISREKLNLSTAAQINVIRTIYVKAIIDNIQESNKWRLWGDIWNG